MAQRRAQWCSKRLGLPEVCCGRPHHDLGVSQHHPLRALSLMAGNLLNHFGVHGFKHGFNKQHPKQS